jgi:hypothetical protein
MVRGCNTGQPLHHGERVEAAGGHVHVRVRIGRRARLALLGRTRG